MANLGTSISWGSNPSTPNTLDSSLWGGISTSSSSVNSTWGSSTPGGLSLGQGHNIQIGASSVGDNQSSNGSASASSWGMPTSNQNGASLATNMSQSQSVSLPSAGQQSNATSLASSQALPFGSSPMPWQSKPFGMRDFTPSSDSSWSSAQSTGLNTSVSNVNKDSISSIAGALPEAGKMDLAAGLASLGIDKSAPPPDWNALKSGWNSTMDPTKLPDGAAVGNADLSFAQATQKGLKMFGVLSPKDEEIRRAIDTNEGWGTRPINQATSWDLDSSPKTVRKSVSENPEMAASNVWNSNNGTAIWESSRESQAGGWGGGAAAGGNMFADKNKPWNMPPKPGMDPNNWGGNGGNNPMSANPMAHNPMSDKSIGNWGGESQQSNKLWGGSTETGSWNEPPQQPGITWGGGGQDTDVGTWEDPASAASRRIINSSGAGPVNTANSSTMSVGGMGGNMNMPMGGGSGMNMNLPMGAGSGMNLPMGGNMPGGMNMPGAGMNMPGGGMNMGSGGMNMPGAGMNMGGMNMGNSSMNMGSGGMNMGNNGMNPMGNSGMNPMGNSGMNPMGNSGMNPMGNSGMNPMGNSGMNPMGNSGMNMGNSGMNMGGSGMNMGGSGMNMGGAGMNMGGSGMNMGAGGMNMGSGGMNMGGSNDAMYWNDPSTKPPNWNPAAAPPRPKPDEPWNKPGMPRPGGNGWGDPSGGNQKADDGTSIWAANAQEQARASGWGEPGAMWNPAFGARPKSTTSWAGNDQDSWQRKMQGQQRFPGSGGQPQMRSKLLQQLLDMGFKKEEAQNALISNNMNFENAVVELQSGKKDMDNDVFQTGAAKIRQGFMSDSPNMMVDDISDSNPHVPNFPLQNTPFNNAQAPNQPFMSGGVNMYDRNKGAGAGVPSNGGLNNNMQHKLKVLQQQQPPSGPGPLGPGSLSPTQSGVRGASTTQTMVQQQAAQQQILQQLRLAVSSGLISPQLLNQQLPHSMLVMLQQLLQLQNALQNLMQRQSFLQQNKVALNIPRPQIDQVNAMITQYKNQILGLKRQLQAAQQTMLMKTQPPSAPTPTPQQIQQLTQQPPMAVPPPALPSSLPGEAGDSVMPLPGDQNGNGMSRLTQWKQATPERDGQQDLNKAPGSKPGQGVSHSHSTPTMGPFGDLTGLNLSGDTTWSSSATSVSSNWPSAPADQGDKGDDAASGLASMLGGRSANLSTDVIPEFVPGKPWTGLNNKSVEDDPHITPGSISRSLSVNVVKDDYLNNLTATSKPSPSFGAAESAWSKLGGGGNVDTSMANALSIGASNLQAQQASRAQSNQWQQQPASAPGFNRQHSWAGRSAFTQVSGSGWDSGRPSPWFKSLSSPEEEQ